MDIVPQRYVTCSSFLHNIVNELFIKTNSALSCSASVESVFSIGKDVAVSESKQLSSFFSKTVFTNFLLSKKKKKTTTFCFQLSFCFQKQQLFENEFQCCFFSINLFIMKYLTSSEIAFIVFFALTFF